MLWFIYNLLFAIGFLAMLPRFLFRMAKRGGYARDFAQRFGRYAAPVRAQLEAGRRVWVHAVSVGEVFVALRFMDELRSRRPGVKFVLSTTTSTGHAIAAGKIAEPDVLIYFPLDFPSVTRRVLDLLRPLALVLVECELWPNLIRLARQRGTPVLLINGRISAHSHNGYRKLRVFTRPLLAQVDRMCVQSEADRDRLVDLGADAARVHIVGSAKYDLVPVDGSGERARAVLTAAGIRPDDLVLLGGSTWAGEEVALLDIYKSLRPRFPRLALVLVPRHAERAGSVLKEIEARGLSVIRRTAINGGAAPSARADVLLVDTTGELRGFYVCATVIFIGKSLTEHGGQNVIEPALEGKPILVGPNMENFAAIMADFRQADALLQVRDAAQLAVEIESLLSDPARRQGYGERAARLVRAQSGAARKTIDLLEPMMPRDSAV